MKTLNLSLIISLLALVISCGPEQTPPPTTPIKPPTVSFASNKVC